MSNLNWLKKSSSFPCMPLVYHVFNCLPQKNSDFPIVLVWKNTVMLWRWNTTGWNVSILPVLSWETQILRSLVVLPRNITTQLMLDREISGMPTLDWITVTLIEKLRRNILTTECYPPKPSDFSRLLCRIIQSAFSYPQPVWKISWVRYAIQSPNNLKKQ